MAEGGLTDLRSVVLVVRTDDERATRSGMETSMRASRGHKGCEICGDEATITLHSADPEVPGGRLWANYCDLHDPDRTEAVGGQQR